MANADDVKKETNQELVAWGLDIEEGLTDWEMEFLESAKKRLNSGHPLTPPMRKKLEEIITEKG
jgi:hypothetical protein